MERRDGGVQRRLVRIVQTISQYQSPLASRGTTLGNESVFEWLHG